MTIHAPPTYAVPLAKRDLVFIDLETTGLDPHENEIVELALLRLSFDLQRTVARYETRCVAKGAATEEARAVNRYDPAKWADAIAPADAMVHIDTWIDDTVLIVGQNTHFDWAFLRETHRREHMALPRTKYLLDTAAIAWPLVVSGVLPDMRLETLCTYFGVSNEGAHGAMVDVERTVKVYAEMMGLKLPVGWGIP